MGSGIARILSKKLLLNRYMKEPEEDKMNNRLIFKSCKSMIIITLMFYIFPIILIGTAIASDGIDLAIYTIKFFISDLFEGYFDMSEFIEVLAFIFLFIGLPIICICIGRYSAKSQRNSFLVLTDEYIEYKEKRMRYSEIKSIKNGKFYNYLIIRSESSVIKVPAYIAGRVHLLSALNDTEVRYKLSDVISAAVKDLKTIGIELKYVDYENKFYVNSY